MSYRDDPPVFFAAERTWLAWQRTAVAVIGLGSVVERFGLFTRCNSGGPALPPGQVRISAVFGALLLIGAALAALSAVQHRRFPGETTHPELPRGNLSWPATATNAVPSATALAMATWFVVAS